MRLKLWRLRKPKAPYGFNQYNVASPSAGIVTALLMNSFLKFQKAERIYIETQASYPSSEVSDSAALRTALFLF